MTMDELVIVPHAPAPVPFDKEAYGSYKIAQKFGETISGIDDPDMVAAAQADHMRDDDYVIGLEFRGQARAYPLWVVDHYHVVNENIDGERFFVTSCERCQSGAAFMADVPGNPERAPLFRAVGFLNATLLLKDMRSGSHWVHYEGAGLDRKAAGRRLPWIPTFHMEWRDWIALHPDTVVMLPPDDPAHPDARHGHGREEIFARPGMDPAFIATILGPLDESYPENEMVLGLAGEESWHAFPLREVQREGGVVNASIGRSVVVFAGPGEDGFTMSAFTPSAEKRTLTFERRDGVFFDRETSTTWTIDGVAVAGPLRGHRLGPVPWYYVRWHAWIYVHRDTSLFVSSRPRARFEPSEDDTFAPLLVALAETGSDIITGEALVSQRRPRAAVASATVYVDGDRIRLHEFATESAARDFDTFSGSWCGFPVKPRSHEVRTRRIGRIVIESDPEDRFADPAQVVGLPPSVVPWAKAMFSDALDDLARTLRPSRHPGETPGFADIVRGLRLAGFEIIEVGFLPPSQLRVGATNGIALTIDGERFLMYAFGDEQTAAAYAGTERYAAAFGKFVVRSTPETMYLHQAAEILYPGDDHVMWSPLMAENRFISALNRAIDNGKDEMTSNVEREQEK